MASRTATESESDKYECAHRVEGALHPELEGDLEAGRRARGSSVPMARGRSSCVVCRRSRSAAALTRARRLD